jgi:hypothetical protein
MTQYSAILVAFSLENNSDSRIKYLSVLGSFVNISDRFTAVARVTNFALNSLSLFDSYY